jgi:hypothetical protein
VSDHFPTTEDEYDFYVASVYGVLRASATADDAARNVARRLAEIATEEMEMGVTEADCQQVGETIAAWYSNSRFGWKELRLSHQAGAPGGRSRPEQSGFLVA